VELFLPRQLKLVFAVLKIFQLRSHIAKVGEPSMCLPKAVEPSMFGKELHSNTTLPLSNCRSNPIFCSGICFVMTLDLGVLSQVRQMVS